MKGHIASDAEVKFKEGDEELYRLQAYTTDKIVLFTTGGKAYTIGADKLPSGRSLGEPVRLMADIGDQEICSIIVPKLDTKYLVASSQGKGFLINGEDMIASTKTGKAILTVEDKHKAILCKAMTGDHIALVGQNRKMLMIESAELPVMNKGKGVFLQRFKDGDLSDATSFNLNDGLIWKGNKTPFKDYTEYKAARASFGRLAPRGFPRDNRF
jgi:topoisomerase-4 subunit A